MPNFRICKAVVKKKTGWSSWKDRSRQNRTHAKIRGGHLLNCLHTSARWSESVELLMKYDASENVFCGHRNCRNLIECFAKSHLDINKILKKYAETLICETILGFLTMSSYSQYDLKGKAVFNWRVHRKTTQQQQTTFAGSSLCGAKLKIPENSNSS